MGTVALLFEVSLGFHGAYYLKGMFYRIALFSLIHTESDVFVVQVCHVLHYIFKNIFTKTRLLNTEIIIKNFRRKIN